MSCDHSHTDLETFSEIQAIVKKEEGSPVNIANVLENCFS